jgi:tetratricopeptide (TPR) repeat protein
MISETAVPVGHQRYQIQESLGHGSMGQVYRVLDRLTSQEVALKQVYLLDNLALEASGGRIQLTQEFQLLASLRHPHIINVLDYGFTADGQPFYTMEYLPQASTILVASQQQSLARKIAYVQQMLQALAYLHRRGILHRDLKPDNVLVHNDQVKLLDFGLSLLHEQGDATLQGTVAYLAPELLQGAPPAPTTDLFACGLIAYELLAGQHPFNTSNPNRLLLDLLYAPIAVETLPAPQPIQQWIGRMLARDPQQRPSSAQEAIIQLHNALNQTPPPELTTIRDSYLQAARFIGRQAERQQLSAAMQQARVGQGNAWLIGGESGVGKSRLLAELRTEALVSGMLVLQGHAIEEGGLPFQLWRDLLRWLLLLSNVPDSQASALKTIVPDLDHLLARPIPAPPHSIPKRQIVEAIVALFTQLTQSTLLILEDVQWAGEGLAVLQALIPLVPALPLCILANYRDDERPELPTQLPGSQTMKLNRLNNAEVAELCVAILGTKGQQRQLVQLLQRETEGNTFFLVEVMRVLADESGQLDAIGQQPLPTHITAGGVQQVVQRRLARVPEVARPLLNCAAVAGRQLNEAVLQALVAQGAVAAPLDLAGWLILCADTAVLELHDAQWRFSHDKLREGVLAALSPMDRARLHRQVAEAIESTYPQRPEWAQTLVKHWQEAGDAEREMVYAPTAVHQMLRLFNYAELLSLGWRTLAWMLNLLSPMGPPLRVELLTAVRRALEADVAQWPARVSPPTLITLLPKIGEAHYRLGEIVVAAEVLTLARLGAERWGQTAVANQAIFWLSQTAAAAGDYERAEQLLHESRALAETTGDRPILLESLVGLADHHWRRGELAATNAYCEQALHHMDNTYQAENPDLAP